MADEPRGEQRDVTPPNLPFKLKPRLVIIIAVVIAVVAIFSTSFFVVDQTETAVVLRFGRYFKEAGPGLHFKLPFNVDRNFNVPTQIVQNMTFGYRTESPGINTRFSDVDYPEESIMLTGDLNIVDVEWVIQYRIVDPYAWLFNVQDQERTIRDISQSVINRLVGDRAIANVIGNDRAVIEVEGLEEMNAILASYGLGINLTAVKTQNIVPPAGRVQDAFEDVNKSIQDMNRLINEGREAYNTEIPKVRGEAQQMIQIAEGYRSERVNEATGDVARFSEVLTRYQEDPETTRNRLYIEMVEAVFATEEGSQLIDRNLSNFLPLLNLQGGVQ